MAGLFAPPPSAEEDRRQAIFRSLKPLTVPILAHVPLQSSGAPALARLLYALLERLKSFSADDCAVVTPALSSYIIFPISQLLESTPLAHIPDDALAGALSVLATVARMWRRCAGGMEEARWLELLGAGALALGGPLGQAPRAKGKGIQRTQVMKQSRDETVLGAGVDLLEALLEAVLAVETEDVIGSLDEMDVDAVNGKAQARPPAPPNSSIPILFHALTALLDIASGQDSVSSLRTKSLVCARHLLLCMAAHGGAPSSSKGRDSVASALPGCASAVCKVVVNPGAKSEEIVAALAVLEHAIDFSVGEQYPEIAALLKESGHHEETSGRAKVEELVESWKKGSSASRLSTATAVSRPTPSPQSQIFSRSLPWLRRTTYHLLLSLRLLASPLSVHHHAAVRAQWTLFCVALLHSCPDVLSMPIALDDDRSSDHADAPDSEGLRIVIEALLRSCADAWNDVSAPAKAALLKEEWKDRPRLARQIWAVVQGHLAGLSRLLTRKDDDRVRVSADVIASGIAVLSSLPHKLQLSGAGVGALERWTGPLLVGLALELPRLAHERRGGASAESPTRRAFKGIASGTSVLLLDDGSAPARLSFPALRFRNVGDPPAIRSLEHMLASLGDLDSLSGWPDRATLTTYLLGISKGESTSPKGLTALAMVVLGMEGATVRDKAARKLARKAAYTIAELATEDDEVVEPPLDRTESSTSLVDPTSDSVMEVAHVKGNTALASQAFTSLKPASATPLEDARVTRESRRALRAALIVRGLAGCATILETAFRPLLFDVLYLLLAQLASFEPFVAEHARIALTRIAFDCGYASPTNLLLDNVDYVVDAVSRRLKLPDLDPQAPRVLAAMIQVAGAEIVPFVQDVVEECFDALDDFHAYDALCAGLMGVFDTLLKAVSDENPSIRPRKPSRFRKRRPDPEAEKAKLDAWLKHRERDEIVPGEDDFPADYWLPSYMANVNDDMEDEETGPPTRTQIVCAAILAKSIPFLSHPASFLRARVLALIATAVPILGARSTSEDASLLPLIHRAWPFVLHRLNVEAEEPFVCAEACRLVEALAVHAGEFMRRRIVEDAWPKFKSLLRKRAEAERKATLKAWGQTTSHRLAAAVLGTMTAVARGVDLAEAVAWDVTTAVATFLRASEHEDLQRAARGLYVALAEENADSVWLVLMSVSGQLERTSYMAIEGTTANAEMVLKVI